MPSTPEYDLPYPDLSGPADGPAAFQSLAEAVEDALLEQAQWQSYTPTVAGTLGNGSISGGYQRVGRMVDFRISLTVGSTSSLSSPLRFGLPPINTVSPVYTPIGQAVIVDVSATNQALRVANVRNVDTIGLMNDSASQATSTSPYALATGDTIVIVGRYETGA